MPYTLLTYEVLGLGNSLGEATDAVPENRPTVR